MNEHVASFSTGDENSYYESTSKLKVMEREESLSKIMEQNEVIIKQQKVLISLMSPKSSKKESRVEKYKKSIVNKS